jgi:hypothetical protein
MSISLYHIARSPFAFAGRRADIDIAAAEGLDETGLPSEAYVPTASGEHAPIPSQSQGYPAQPGSGNKTVFDAGH